MRALVIGGALLLVLATGMLVAPAVIKRAGLHERVASALAAQLGGPVELSAVRLTLFPLPHVVLDQLRLTVAPTVDAGIASVSLYPRLRALLSGKLQLAQVDLAGASVQLHLERAAAEPAPEADTTVKGLRDAAAAAVAAVSSVAAAYAPGLIVRLSHATVDVSAADAPKATFTNINGTILLPPDQLRLDLAVGSNLWQQATLHAALDPGSVRGDGHLTLTGFRPQALGSYVALGDLEIGNATAALDVRVTANGLDALRADVDVALPTLPLRRGADQLTMEGAHVSAGITLDRERIGVTLHNAHFANPPAQLSGTLVLDRRTPQVRLEVTGTDLDVRSAHGAAAFFAAANPTARTIFAILQAGKVPQLTLEAQGRTLAELASLDAMVIRGALAGGKVRLPGNGLDLDDVSGEVSITNGVLVGAHATARVGNTQARDGSVRIGLTGESQELSVTTAVQADVRDLPEVLKRVVANDTLTRTLERLTDVQGKAEGQFMLRGTTGAATAAVDVSQLSVSARVRNLDQPVQIEGGPFHYDPGAIAATALKVTAGNSTLSQLSVRVDTSVAVPSIDVSGASGRIALAEIYSWVAASGWLPESGWTPKTLAGTLAVDSVRVRGPAATPSDWHIELAGAARNLDIDAPRLRQVSTVRFPVSLSTLRVTRAPAATTVATGVATADGLTGMVDLVWNAAGLDIKRLSVRDAQSDATLSLRLEEREFDLTFAGSLNSATLEALLRDEHDVAGSIHGDFRARILMDQPARSTASGRLEAVHVALPGPGDLRLHVAHADLHASGGLLAIDAEGAVGDGPFLHLHGSLRPATDALIADLDVSAGRVEWVRLAPLLAPSTASDGESGPAARHPLRVRGKVRINAESFTYDDYTWQPVHAVVDLSGALPSITVTQANLCRIATPGKIAPTPGGVSVHFKPAAKNQLLGEIVGCLFGRPARVTGQCSLAAQIDAAGPAANILTSARGHVQLDATKGRFYQGGVIEKVLAVMSIGHGSWNLLADLTDDGLPYNTIDAKADLRDGKLVLTEVTVDAPSVKMGAEGTIDLTAGTVDLTLLAAPLKTVDTVVSHVPVLGRVLGGSLLTIPIKVRGSLRDPEVIPLDPSEVGSGLLRVMTRVVKLPLRLLEPFRSGEGKP